MRQQFKYRVLIVDDNEALLATTAATLSHEGYDVETARDGFEALAALRGSLPDLIISDLKMPNMSGFELLAVVRKRFPGIAVIASSAEFTPVSVPAVLADRYLQKGVNATFELVELARELLSQSPLRSQPAKADSAPAWIPHSANGDVVVTCPSCLRSFSVACRHLDVDGAVTTEKCLHCGEDVAYRIDTTVAETGGAPMSVLEGLRRQVQSTRDTIERTKQRVSDSRRPR
jgi:CheY-like chemotaxis protein